jgi:hypothetical protein
MTQLQKDVYAGFVSQAWKPVGPSSFSLFQSYSEQDKSLLQQRSATSLCTWTRPGQGLWKIIEGSLCSAYWDAVKPLCFVIHENAKSRPRLAVVLDELYRLNAEAAGLETPASLEIVFNDEAETGRFKNLADYDVEIQSAEETAEYLYRTSDVCSLKGKAGRERRHAVNVVEALGKVEIVKVQGRARALCMGLENEWCQRQNCIQCSSYYGCERSALGRMLEIFDDNLHECYICRVNGRPRGYLIAMKKESSVFMLYGKGLEANMLPYIVYRVCRDFHAESDWINYAEDMGDPGLRTAKQRFAPYSQIHRYRAALRRKTNG